MCACEDTARTTGNFLFEIRFMRRVGAGSHQKGGHVLIWVTTRQLNEGETLRMPRCHCSGWKSDKRCIYVLM
jgi:hypothetical protein